MTEAWTDTKVSVCTSVFYGNKANSAYQNRGQKTILNCKEEKDENRH